MIGSFFGGIHGFFQSSTWTVIQSIAILFVVALWAATVYWVHKDAMRRIRSTVLVWLSTIVGAVPPFFGPLIYMLFRPPEYLDDVRERELEIQAIERRLGERVCPACRAEVDSDFLICPVCTTRLKQSCTSCSRPLDSSWLLCPYCEAPVRAGEVTTELWPSAVQATQVQAPAPAAAPRTPRRTTRKAT